MTRYWVNYTTGNDANPGTSKDRPWKTTAPVQAGLDLGIIGPGDMVLWNRGDVWPTPVPQAPIPNGIPRQRLIFRAYGIGPRPKFSGYKTLNLADGWQEAPAADGFPAGTWRIDLAPNSGTHGGNVDAPGYNIGHLLVDGRIKPAQKQAKGALVNLWDWYTSPSAAGGTMLYVRTDARPTTLSSDIKAAPYQTGVIPRTMHSLLGLHIEGFGIHGVRTRAGNDGSSETAYTDIAGCEIANIGGSRQSDKDGNPGLGPRLGNGIESWIGSNFQHYERNYIHDIYDAGITLQGEVLGSWVGWRGHEIAYNRVERANQTFEFWAKGSAPAGGFRDIRIHHNIGMMAGYSWGDSVRSDTNGKANHIMTYEMTLPVVNMVMERNLFYGSKELYCYHSQANAVPDPTPTAGIIRRDNVVVLESGLPIMYGDSRTWLESDSWVAAMGQEAGTVFVPIHSSVAPGERQAMDEALENIASSDAANALYNEIVTAMAFELRESDPPEEHAYRNRYYGPASYGSSAVYGTTGRAAGQVWRATRGGQLKTIACGVKTAAGAGGVVRGILWVEEIDGGWTRIGNVGAVSATSVGQKTIDVTTARVFMEPGRLYWVSFALQGNTSAPGELTATTGWHDPEIATGSAANIIDISLNGYELAGVTGDNAPTSVAALTGITNAPKVALQFA